MLTMIIIGAGLVALVSVGFIANEIGANKMSEDIMKDAFKKW